MAKKLLVGETTLENLLYLSRLSPEGTSKEILAGQVRQIEEYVEILSKYAEDEDIAAAYPATEVEQLRDSTVAKALESADLKKITPEFMDGYFRVPKVLGGGA